ncbi:MAG: alpha/beta hydrolase family esterase [Alphaproteobacteria bacterium]
MRIPFPRIPVDVPARPVAILRSRRAPAAVLGILLAACGGDGSGGGPVVPDSRLPVPAAETREVPGYPDRAVLLFGPGTQAGPVPLVLVLHGGASNPEGMRRIACPGGDVQSPDCLDRMGAAAGVAVAYPSGNLIGGSWGRARTWNAGGGVDGWKCVSGPACFTHADDVAYLAAVVDDLASTYAIDRSRVFATGLSNGGAMSYRLACDSDLVSAIAPVSGANQLAAAASCTPSGPVSVLHFHGTADPCWPFDGGPGGCIDPTPGVFVGVEESLSGTAGLLGCRPDPSSEPMPDTEPDGMTSARLRWQGCAGRARLEMLRVSGGGHTWPGGYQYLPPRNVGPMTSDFDANEEILRFFRDAPARTR